MKYLFVASATSLLLLLSSCPVFAQDSITVVAPSSEAGEGLDLAAVGQLFKDSQNLEAFEKSLNDPQVGINNLDLDENGEVDFIRVVEQVADDTHLIVLQVQLAKDEFQDVATIEVEKSGDNQYNLQIRGDESIYGIDYYIVPADVYIYRWPIITGIYRPLYRPYRSVFYIGSYPHWYRPYRPVTVNVYRTRTVRLTGRASFTVTRTSRVKSVSKVHYTRRTSTTVTKRTRTTTRSAGRTTTVTRKSKTTVRTKRGGRRP
jgi:hypothetical protein